MSLSGFSMDLSKNISGEKFSGGLGGRETPVPIPNTEVKPLSVDGTARVTVWESRTLPGVKLKPRFKAGFLFWQMVHGYLAILVWLRHELLPY